MNGRFQTVPGCTMDNRNHNHQTSIFNIRWKGEDLW